MKKLTAAALIIGVICMGSSLYIKGEVREGQKKIANAQRNVDQGTSLFSITPLTKPFGDGLSRPVQKEIDQGKQDVAYYTALSNWLMIIGTLFLLGGAASFFIRKKRS